MQNGKTEYKSVTVAEDSTAEEFMDFYLDDDCRTTWVSPHTLTRQQGLDAKHAASESKRELSINTEACLSCKPC